MMNRCFFLLATWLVSSLLLSADIEKDAERAIERGVKFFNSISTEGGYVYFVTPDLSERWGEGVLDAQTIEVQPPGTPAVGMALLRAYKMTKYAEAMRAVKETAQALIRGQNEYGGWGHVIHFDRVKSKVVSFDDDQTQSALSFLMAVEQEFSENEVAEAVQKGLNMMVTSQLRTGGWPHQYPKQRNYHDFATFNDQGINDCIRVMLEADEYYSNPQIKSTLHRAVRFLMISQLPTPQAGWAQQYNDFLQPAWARSFEPPSLCPSATLNNLDTLMDLAVHLDNREYLEPIHDSLRWLEDTQLPNGLWARFIELGTGKPLYYDRGRIRVNSTDELSEERRLGYGYETDLSDKLEHVKSRFNGLWNEGRDINDLEEVKDADWWNDLESRAVAIIEAQDKKGRWITVDDRFKKQIPGQRWNGEWEVKDRISSQVFIDNMSVLADYLQLFKRKGWE